MSDPFKVPSEMFREAFTSNGAGCRRDCQCGRIWFEGDATGYTWDDGEFEKLTEMSKATPNLCVEVHYSIPTYYFEDSEIVWDCKCFFSNKAAEFEHTVLAEAQRVARLLNSRAKQLRLAAERIEVNENGML